MIKAICIDSENKPLEIPPDKWVVKDRPYTITHVYKMAAQDYILGVGLKEINLLNIPNCPYECFKASRFGISIHDLQAFIEVCKLCSELDGVNIEELIEEQIIIES